MNENELKWERWAKKECDGRNAVCGSQGAGRGIEAFKQALRKRIQERAPHDGTAAFLSVDEILQLIDQVQPPTI